MKLVSLAVSLSMLGTLALVAMPTASAGLETCFATVQVNCIDPNNGQLCDLWVGGVAGTCLVAGVPVPAAPNATPCNPTQNPHQYANTGVAGDSRNAQADAAFGVEDSTDGCNANLGAIVDAAGATDTNPATNCITGTSICQAGTTGGDGDPETGVGGGAFPAGPCVPAGTTAHHANADGSAYYISSALPLIPAALSVGTDGGSTDGACTGGNGIVSNDPTTDPTDCGSGNTGLSTPMTPATIGANVAGLSCTPSGGFVAGFTQTGPIFVDNGHCVLPVVHTGIDNDLNGDPTVPTVDPGDQSGCGTITLQTVAVSVEGFIGDAGF